MPTDATPRFGCEYQMQKRQSTQEIEVEDFDDQRSMFWVALRAGVLRRAISQRGTAQERGAVFNAGAASDQRTPISSRPCHWLGSNVVPRALNETCIPSWPAGTVRAGTTDNYIISYLALRYNASLHVNFGVLQNLLSFFLVPSMH